MQIILPEIVAEVRELSVWLPILAFGTALLFGLSGWSTYRFWAVLFTTVAAGLYGLLQAESLNLLPAVAALLLALSAGMLALSIMRVVAFILGGVSCLMLMHLIAPGADAPVICILSGGVFAIILFRLWIMFLTSFAGSVVITYCVLCFFDRLGSFDSVKWSQENVTALNWICLIGAGVITVAQYYWNQNAKSEKKDKPADKPKEGGDKKPPASGGKKGMNLKWLKLPFGKAA